MYAVIGIADSLKKQGHGEILSMLHADGNFTAKDMHCLFISFNEKGGLGMMSLTICFKIPNFSTKKKQRALALEEITKLKNKKPRSKACRKLHNEFSSEPSSKKARHSKGQGDSSSNVSVEISDCSDEMCDDSSVSSGGQVQTFCIEGSVQFFDS